MNGTSRTNSACESAEQLIAYIYGEANAAETSAFEQHLKTCVVCRDELVAFGHLRSGISAWHSAVLQNAPPLPALSFETAHVTPKISQMGLFGAAVQQTTERKHSALAALREFFWLSPLWLKAGSFATVLAMCALAILALVNAEVRWDNNGIAFSTGTRKVQTSGVKNAEVARSVSNDSEAVALREQVKTLTTERAALQAEREDLRGKLDKTNSQLTTQANMIQTLNASVQRANQQTKPRIMYVKTPMPIRTPRKNQPVYEAGNDERDVPRLIDLIGDSKN